MERRVKLIYIEDLKDGMILSKDLEINGRVLLVQDTQLTENIIYKLKNQYILDKIEVYDDKSQLYENMFSEKEKSIEEIEESFQKLTDNMKDIFEGIYSIQSNGIEEVRKFAKKIQEELKSTSSVIKNIVIKGSGDDAIYRHSVNVAALSAILGKWIGLDEVKINLLTYSAILHDFGKTQINPQILNKKGKLRKDEIKEIERHPTITYNHIKEISFLDSSVSYGVLMHHEREDGSGYPLGIKGDKIHIFSKIIAIADVFDVVNSNRGYKKKKGALEALEIIKEEGLRKLNYEYCDIFLKHIINYYMGESVLLSDGNVGKIIQLDINNISEPLLLCEDKFIDVKKEKNIVVENLIL